MFERWQNLVEKTKKDKSDPKDKASEKEEPKHEENKKMMGFRRE